MSNTATQYSRASELGLGQAKEDLPVRVPTSRRVTNLFAVLIPFAAVVLAIVWSWGHGINLAGLAVLCGMIVITGYGITIGYHRLFTHRSFQTYSMVQFFLAVCGSMAVEGPLMRWVATHRKHHQCSDVPGDPHSPHLHDSNGLRGLVVGLWHAHAGWLLDRCEPNMARYAGDLRKSRMLRLVSRLFPLWVLIGLTLPMAAGGLITGTWGGAALGLLWGGLVRIFLVHHITWSINSICHCFGRQPFNCKDESRNNVVMGVLAFGEGWHNNHHAFPSSARHGLAWWQFDSSYLIIRLMEKLRLAWNLRLPTDDMIELARR